MGRKAVTMMRNLNMTKNRRMPTVRHI